MAPKRHESLWFSSGDVVLSTNIYLFKVHKELLALQSSVFKDMFELEQPVEGVQGIVQELYEGLPLVALVGDEGKDVAHLLKAVYYRDYYDRDNDKTPLEIIVALLVLGNKYDFKHIQSDVMKQLLRLYPNTLDGFDDVDQGGYDCNLFGVHRVKSDFKLLEACHTANVAVLLPILYYACSEFTVEWIYEQVDEVGGLHASCLRTLLTGKCKLSLALRTLVAFLPDEFSNISCSSCKAGASVRHLHHQHGSHLWTYKGQDLAQSVLKDGCKQCTANLATRIDEKREEIWEKIPSFFGFAGWDELQ
ncbi:hypothetical protein SCHPADRAFT_835399 [Schizopora paradoxa]|uniref:BTB domain-containing protein n=1 Tax=Schizopora paradoxa TaxID=27342 RepID=A0A0H2RUD6_9AGAM|nr:hypothetical protein SCHPADRAFT_835399 [Schizopora paradoxa]